MSTISKLSGSQFKVAKQRRMDAMKFFASQQRLPGIPGRVATQVLMTLQAIHRDPTLNGPQKEIQFKRVIQVAQRAGKPAE